LNFDIDWMEKVPKPKLPKGCPFCNFVPMGRVYYTCDDYKVVRCITCGKPLIIYTKHLPKPSKELIAKSYITVVELFGPDIGIDRTMGMYPEHAHYHVNTEGNIKITTVSTIKRRARRKTKRWWV